MCARLLGSIGLAAVVVLLPLAKAQDSKKGSDSSSSTTDSDTLKAGEYVGKLVAAPGSDGTFMLRLEHYEPKDAAAARQAVNQLNADVQRAQQLEQQVAINGTAQQLHDLNQTYGRIRKKLAQQGDLFNVVAQDIEFHAADNMVVRFLQPPVIYNDKGERKKLSPLDLQEMRGLNPNIPGFEAKLSDLQGNQIVRVSLRPAAKPASGGDKKKPAPKMEATMAVIVVAEDMSPVSDDSKKKKGK
jgi:hypothetical protein